VAFDQLAERVGVAGACSLDELGLAHTICRLAAGRHGWELYRQWIVDGG
jgi:hypothetical protein